MVYLLVMPGVFQIPKVNQLSVDEAKRLPRQLTVLVFQEVSEILRLFLLLLPL